MVVEHIALNVEKPVKMAKWYLEVFDMQVLKKYGETTFFLGDEKGHTILEIYHNPKSDCLDYKNMNPLMLHVAFVSEDIDKDMNRLLEAGATMQDKKVTTEAGDTLVMLRDPWGLCIQLVQRAKGNEMK